MLKLPENKPRELEPTSKMKLFIYGEPYTGKTVFASQFPKPLILSTDGNYKHITTPVVDIDNNTNWNELIDLLAKKDNDFETIIIDLVDHLIDMVRDDILGNYSISHESDLPHGKGWNLVKKPIYTILRKIVSLPYNIIFIGHSNNFSNVDKMGRETNYINSTLPEKTSNVIKGLVDCTLYTAIEKEETKDESGNRIITTHYKLYLNAVDDGIKMGSRALFAENIIDTNYSKFIELYTQANLTPATEIVIKKPDPKALKPLKKLPQEDIPQKDIPQKKVKTTKDSTLDNFK